MDPDANLAEQLRLARGMQELSDADTAGADEELIDQGLRIAELVIALNDWVRSGGYLPKAWQH